MNDTMSFMDAVESETAGFSDSPPVQRERKSSRNEDMKINDLSSVFETLPSDEFGIQMHRRITDLINIRTKAQGQLDLEDINTSLINLPAAYSWTIIESARADEVVAAAEDKLNEYYRKKYDQANQNLMEVDTKKITKDIIESQVVKEDELARKMEYERLIKNGLSKTNAEIEMRYFGLDGRRRYVRELTNKASILKEHCRLMGQLVPILQTLSKNINIEWEASKRGM